MTLSPRAVVVHRRSELELLLERHATRGQAEFFLRSRGRSLEDVQVRHDALSAALQAVDAAIPSGWRRAAVEREDLPRLRFDPEDVVIAVGQDGLVANVAKYLHGQPVVGVDPEPGFNAGVLVRHDAGSVASVLSSPATATLEQRCLVEATLDDGQSLRALNEVYVGDSGHQSARYRVYGERQSSSGVLIGTGTGATGWCASLARERAVAVPLPGPLDASLAWFVREAWPSPSTGTSHTQGLLEPGATLTLVAEGDLVIFGDGLERDRLLLTWGQQLTVAVSPEHLRLVV